MSGAVPASGASPAAWAALARYLVGLDVTDKGWSPALTAVADTAVPLSAASTPALTLDVAAAERNLLAMQEWTDARGAVLAPHGKTTMTPALWHWQLAAGAWAITVATEAQLRVARVAGVRRVLVANELLSPTGLAWLAGELDADPGLDVTCWVDSVEAVHQMTRALDAAGARRPVGVCVELGVDGGRTGARTDELARTVAHAARDSDRLELRGVAAYEGSVPGQDEADKVAGVRAFLARTGRTFVAFAGLLETPEPILTAGGSAYFDLVAEELSTAAATVPGARLVLRSGAYLVHDDGLYRGSTPAATRSGPVLEAAAHVWSRVLSVPEPHLALLDAGKRDLPYDAGLPELQRVVRAGTDEVVAAPGCTVTGTNDQHTYVRLDEPGSLAVGDVVRLGLSHPCTMFDKWRTVVLVEPTEPGGAAEPSGVGGSGPQGVPTVRGALLTWF